MPACRQAGILLYHAVLPLFVEQSFQLSVSPAQTVKAATAYELLLGLQLFRLLPVDEYHAFRLSRYCHP